MSSSVSCCPSTTVAWTNHKHKSLCAELIWSLASFLDCWPFGPAKSFPIADCLFSTIDQSNHVSSGSGRSSAMPHDSAMSFNKTKQSASCCRRALLKAGLLWSLSATKSVGAILQAFVGAAPSTQSERLCCNLSSTILRQELLLDDGKSWCEIASVLPAASTKSSGVMFASVCNTFMVAKRACSEATSRIMMFSTAVCKACFPSCCLGNVGKSYFNLWYA